MFTMTLHTADEMSEEMLHWDKNSTKYLTKHEKRKSRVVQELEEKRMREQLLEEMECKKKFKAHEVPEHVRIPLYEDVLRQQEERKQLIKQRSRVMLQMVKPFSFVDKERSNIPYRNLKDKHTREDKLFKAMPFPSKIFDPSFEEKMKEKEFARKNATENRSKVLLQSSSAPKSVVEHDKLAEKRECKNKIFLDFVQNRTNTFRPKINHEVPNFEILHRQILKQKSSGRVLNTKCTPFNFETEQRKKKQENERQISSASTISSRIRSLSALRSISMDVIPIVATKTSLLRAKNARNQSEEIKQLSKMMAKKAQIKEIRSKNLQRAVREKSSAHDPSAGRIASTNSSNQRTCQYLKQLNDINRRVSNRPLLFEQVVERSARLRAEMKHQEVLNEYGVEYDDLQHIGNIDSQAEVLTFKGQMADMEPTQSPRGKSSEVDENHDLRSRSSYTNSLSGFQRNEQLSVSSIQSDKTHSDGDSDDKVDDDVTRRKGSGSDRNFHSDEDNDERDDYSDVK